MTANSYLSKTPNASNRKTLTISVWLKRSLLGSSPIFTANTDISSDASGHFAFDGDDTLHFRSWPGSSPYAFLQMTQRKFVDTTAWYHILVAQDTTQATASNRIKIYINGVQESVKSSSTQPSQNYDGFFNSNILHNVGRGSDSGIKFFEGQMAHFHFVDGTAYTPSTFGETDSTTGIWKPKTNPSVTYGTNGFFLKFENSGALGTDSSGNTNTYAVSGDLKQSISTPSDKFPSFNPRGTNRDYDTAVYQLNAGHTALMSTGVTRVQPIDMCFAGGKWYWEAKIEKNNNSSTLGVYLTDATSGKRIEQFNADLALQTASNGGNGALSFLAGSSSLIQMGNSTTSYGTGISDGDIIMFAFDSATGKVWTGRNGTWFNAPSTSNVGNPATGANDSGKTLTNNDNELYSFYIAGRNSDSTNRTIDINFGHGYFGTTAVASANADGNGKGSFEYAPPSGFLALCSSNIQSSGG